MGLWGVGGWGGGGGGGGEVTKNSRPCILGTTKRRNCAIISQYILPLSQCTFSKAIPVCLSLQNRSLIPVPHKYSSTTSMMPSLLSKFLPWWLVFRFGNRQKSEGVFWRIRGDEEGPKAVFSRSSHSNERCGLVYYLARAQHLESIFLFFTIF